MTPHARTMRRMPRQGSHPPAEKRVQVIVEPDQKRLYQLAAEVTGRTMSQWVRFHLDRQAEEDIRMSRQHVETMSSIKGEVKAVGGGR